MTRILINAVAAGRFFLVQLQDGRKVMATMRRGYAEGRYALSGPYADENAAIESASPILITRQ